MPALLRESRADVRSLHGKVTVKVIFAIQLVNPLTPRSDQYIDSPYAFNTLSSRQVMRTKKFSTRGYFLDITPNSQD